MSASAGVTFPLWAWAVFIALVIGLLLLDLLVFHRGAQTIPIREAVRTTVFWVAVALAFGGFVWTIAGLGVASEYLTGYLVEWSLSVDNVFIFSVIFTSFAVPEQYRYKVLFWGVIVALVARAVFVAAGSALLSAFSWLVFVFGVFLIFTGIEGAVDRFVYLHYGLAAILVFVGARFLLEGFGLHIPIAVSLPVIALAVGASIAASLYTTRGPNSNGEDHESREGESRGGIRSRETGDSTDTRGAKRDGEA